MGKFMPPEWQRGYRYISVAQRVVAVRAERPIPILMTHDIAGAVSGKTDFCVLSRVAMLISTGEDRQWFHECGARRHTYHPWGIENKAKPASGRLDVSMTTLPLARRSGFLVEASFVNVSSHPVPLSLSFVLGGVGMEEDPRMFPDFSEAENDVLSHTGRVISIFDKEMREPKIHVAAACNKRWDVRTIDYLDVFDKNPHQVTWPLALATVLMGIIMPGSQNVVYLAFEYGDDEAEIQTSVVGLASQAEAEKEKTVAHFTALHDQTHIKTPSGVLDHAFSAAVCNLEYAWWEGLGWMEIPSYWNGFFEQTQIVGAASLGQLDRAKDCLLACGLKTDQTGQIPVPTLGGGSWFGAFDWTHYFILGFDYFHRSTADVDVLKTLWPHMARAYDQWLAKNTGPDGLMLSWDSNFLEAQEDDIRTPYHGSSPTILGIMMSQKMAGFAQTLGLEPEAKRYRQRAAQTKALLQEELWDARRGSFLYWIDEEGVRHTQSQHHTYSWPVNFEITDLLDSYTSLRHLRETLISPRDIVYNSNQFPEDRLSCLGAQESILVTGSVAVAFARLGDTETCFRILNGASRCIMSEVHEGQVPEQAQIDFQSYFSGGRRRISSGASWRACSGSGGTSRPVS